MAQPLWLCACVAEHINGTAASTVQTHSTSLCVAARAAAPQPTLHNSIQSRVASYASGRRMGRRMGGGGAWGERRASQAAHMAAPCGHMIPSESIILQCSLQGAREASP